MFIIVTTTTFKLVENINPHIPIFISEKSGNITSLVKTPARLDVKFSLDIPSASRVEASGA